VEDDEGGKEESKDEKIDDGDDEDEVEEEEVEEEEAGVKVCVVPLFGVEITILPFENEAVKPEGLVNKLLLVED
jgi:hypothetical protein